MPLAPTSAGGAVARTAWRAGAGRVRPVGGRRGAPGARRGRMRTPAASTTSNTYSGTPAANAQDRDRRGGPGRERARRVSGPGKPRPPGSSDQRSPPYGPHPPRRDRPGRHDRCIRSTRDRRHDLQGPPARRPTRSCRHPPAGPAPGWARCLLGPGEGEAGDAHGRAAVGVASSGSAVRRPMSWMVFTSGPPVGGLWFLAGASPGGQRSGASGRPSGGAESQD